LKHFADGLNIDISSSRDAEDYLFLLRSLEGVMQHVKDDSDYLHPALTPQPTTEPRKYWTLDEKDNPLNAWSHRCILKSANPTNGILKNRTIAVKDNICIGGLPTTLGTFPKILSRDGILAGSPIDATVVSRILAAGAVIKGSSTCENYCASPLSFSSATGPVHNPLLHGYTAGGSSSGSSALVAAGILQQRTSKTFGDTVEIAIGGDQAGSIRIPASYNGIYGLKPTFGLIPYTGAVSMVPMIDHLGPIASNLEDIAALLMVMAGYDGLDSRMTPESPLVGQVKDYSKLLADFRSRLLTRNEATDTILKIGLLKESFDVPGLSVEVRDTVREAARSFFEAAGAKVVDVSIPMHSEGPIIWTASTRPSMSDTACQGKASGYLSYLPPHIQAQWPPSQEMYELLTSTNPAVINIMLSNQFANQQFGPSIEAKAHRKVFELRAAYDRALEEVDVLVTPCAPTVAMPHPPLKDEHGNRTSIMEKLQVAVGLTSNTCPFNVTGHPAISAPCGFSTVPEHPDVQLPIGMQIVGSRWNDETVLMAAVMLEEGRRFIEKKDQDAKYLGVAMN
jgi:amidase